MVDVLKDDANHANNGNDERAKSQSADVVPEGPAKTVGDGEQRKVFALVKGPVPGGEGPGQHHLTESGYEEEAPEEGEHVVNLQPRNVRVLVVLRELTGSVGARVLGFELVRITQSPFSNARTAPVICAHHGVVRAPRAGEEHRNDAEHGKGDDLQNVGHYREHERGHHVTHGLAGLPDEGHRNADPLTQDDEQEQHYHQKRKNDAENHEPSGLQLTVPAQLLAELHFS